MIYIAPARYAFTEAHIPSSQGSVIPLSDPDNLEADRRVRLCEGATACGLEMDPGDLWVPVALRPGDQVRRACEGHGDEQGEMW